VIAIGEAALVELPLAALFGWVAVRFARAVAEARPSLQRAGFRIRHRRLMPPAGDYPALHDAEAAGSQPRWRQWTPRGHAGRPGLLLPWWLPAACLGLVLVLIPWTAWLFVTLPQTELAGQWGLARAGLDLALAIVLAASAVALLRRWPAAEVLVAIAAALLLRDAWFNVLTARRGHSSVALGVAAGLELPLAALCLWVAVLYARAVEVAWPYVRSLRMRAARRDAETQPEVKWQGSPGQAHLRHEEYAAARQPAGAAPCDRACRRRLPSMTSPAIPGRHRDPGDYLFGSLPEPGLRA
jgi:hypothetical protein